MTGDISVRSGGLTNRTMNTNRSQSQIVSQVRVKSFQGGGPAPRLVKLLQNNTNPADIARFRYLSEHEDDVQGMQNFFRRAGLSMQKSVACAEESVCLDANTPRKLFKYVHEVQGFSLIELGMDRIDAELVLEVLNTEFSHKDISAAGAAAAAVAKMMGGTGATFNHYNAAADSGPTRNSISRPTTISMIEKMKPEESAKARRISEHQDDVLDMQEFFRFAGLSIQQSRECAEQAIFMDANSPRKLFKYIEEVKGFQLTDLGMDEVDADMVLQTLRREFGTSTASSSKPRNKDKDREKERERRRDRDREREKERRAASLDSQDYDFKSESSEDSEEKTESLSNPLLNIIDIYPDTKDDIYPPMHLPPTSPIVRKHSPVPMLRAQPKTTPPAQYYNSTNSYASFASDPQDVFKAKVRAALDYQSGRSGLTSPGSPAHYRSSLHSLEVGKELYNLPNRPSSTLRYGQNAFSRDGGDEDAYEEKDRQELHDFLSQVSTAATASDMTGTYIQFMRTHISTQFVKVPR